MKKTCIFFNVVLSLLLIWLVYRCVYDCINANVNFSNYKIFEQMGIVGKEEANAQFFAFTTSMVYAIIDSILIVLICITLFFVNYKIDEVPFYKKISEKIEHQKETKKAYHKEKSEKRKEKQIQKLKSKIDQLNK